jgi:hypothetical protein
MKVDLSGHFRALRCRGSQRRALLYYPLQDDAGGVCLAAYDWNHDGLDEIVNLFTGVFWVKDGTDKNLIDRRRVFVFQPDRSWPTDFWPFNGVPSSQISSITAQTRSCSAAAATCSAS